jgi:hypothetical protein
MDVQELARRRLAGPAFETGARGGEREPPGGFVGADPVGS